MPEAMKIYNVFLSIQAQDFIEDQGYPQQSVAMRAFLSIQAQDFIEDYTVAPSCKVPAFLSIQAQDFIEEKTAHVRTTSAVNS